MDTLALIDQPTPLDARGGAPDLTRPRAPVEAAMVLAAGLGTRMRPITQTLPKPLVRVGGRALLDHALDRVAEAGLGRAVVNVHHLAEQIEAHLTARAGLAARAGLPAVSVSDERDGLLETGGGVVRALPLLGPGPFVVLNSDSFWIEGPRSNLRRLVETWDPAAMDALLLVAPTATSLGYEGRGDFRMDAEGRLTRRPEREVAPFLYAGVAVFAPEAFADAPAGAFSLNRVFDRAAARERLFGLRLDGQWLHVGTPEAIEAAEARVAECV
jgi:N-acetyl-alpha-D-muramate 1-phosphate uridylyltransferase